MFAWIAQFRRFKASHLPRNMAAIESAGEGSHHSNAAIALDDAKLEPMTESLELQVLPCRAQSRPSPQNAEPRL